jgi:hypothetical protein
MKENYFVYLAKPLTLKQMTINLVDQKNHKKIFSIFLLNCFGFAPFNLMLQSVEEQTKQFFYFNK